MTLLCLLTNGDLLSQSNTTQANKQGWGIPRTACPSRRRRGQRPGLAGEGSSWEGAAVPRLALLPAEPPQAKSQAVALAAPWLVKHRGSASVRCGASAQACAAPAGCCLQKACRGVTSEGRKTQQAFNHLTAVNSTGVSVRLCKLHHRYPAVATACSLSYASSSKRAASGAFGIGGTALPDVSRGGRAPGGGPRPRTARRLLLPVCSRGITRTTVLSPCNVSGISRAATTRCWKHRKRLYGLPMSHTAV